MHIGIDFDNTIVCYDTVFYQAALEKGLIPPGIASSKTGLRDYLRANGKEEEWTKLQGYVYGARMDLAYPFPGFHPFIEYCRTRGIQVSIISHKTKTPYLGTPYDLHASAQGWLKNQSFFSSDISVYFELTLQAKLNRIRKSQCDLFIDDLPELLNEPEFPPSVKKILFDPFNLYPLSDSWTTINSWDQMRLRVSTPY